MKTPKTQADRESVTRKRNAGGRPLLHGVKLEPFAFRMPPQMRNAIDDLADAASALAGPDEPRVFDNSVLLLAVSEWLARKQNPRRIREAILDLDFADERLERKRRKR